MNLEIKNYIKKMTFLTIVEYFFSLRQKLALNFIDLANRLDKKT